MNTDQPTPCAANPKLWDSTNDADHTTARDACLGCDALAACIRFRNDQIRNQPDFAFFEGTLAGRLHDPRGDRRRRAIVARQAQATHSQNNFAKANAKRREATHCKRGHEFNEDNTYTSPDGRRTCRVCVRVAKEKWARENGVPVNKATATHCQRGHEYTIENTRIEKDGRRRCRTCRTLKRRERENGGASDAA